jgi:predicted GNAT family acetyltransferase
MSDEIPVRDNPAQHRFEARVGGVVAGFASYQLGEGVITFVHTEVDTRFEGKGVGSALARHALDDVRSRGGLTVVPACAFIKAWIDKHPEYQSLVRQD